MNQLEESKAVVVRSPVPARTNYADYREELRHDFWYACAYCNITECEAWGIGFEIEHYYPKKTHHHLIHKYKNLMWSCRICNRYKDDYSPDPEDVENGRVVLRPDQDHPRDHFELDNQRLKHKTSTGEFNVELLDLNRQSLRRLRGIRKRIWDSSEYIAYGINELASIAMDRLATKSRVVFVQFKDRVLDQHGAICENLEDMIRQLARSPYLDEDPEKKERLKVRREYLRIEKAITVDHMEERPDWKSNREK
jgi:uncharacterized protein (TIGR02646 family)